MNAHLKPFACGRCMACETSGGTACESPRGGCRCAECVPPVVKTKNERFTLPPDVERFRLLAGVEPFDLDPAACLESHHAPAWFCAPGTFAPEGLASNSLAVGCMGENGLTQPWFGSVFVNPPFDDLDSWVRYAADQMWQPEVRSVVMIVPANRTEQPWWQEHVEPHRDRPTRRRIPYLSVRFLPKRVNFGSPASPRIAQKGTPFGCALLIWRMGT